ncbi:MAG: hypothetical protein KUG64_10370 [Cycloclasticus sp.]|jgi:hypothetical protein|nr:hypothetical protein [Cycloclasticus sp.]
MKKSEEDVHVLIKLSREMKGKSIFNSVVIEAGERPNKAHIWQTSEDDIWVVMKEERKFTDFKHFNGEQALSKARSFAKQFVLGPLRKAVTC